MVTFLLLSLLLSNVIATIAGTSCFLRDPALAGTVYNYLIDDLDKLLEVITFDMRMWGF